MSRQSQDTWKENEIPIPLIYDGAKADFKNCMVQIILTLFYPYKRTKRNKNMSYWWVLSGISGEVTECRKTSSYCNKVLPWQNVFIWFFLASNLSYLGMLAKSRTLKIQKACFQVNSSIKPSKTFILVGNLLLVHKCSKTHGQIGMNTAVSNTCAGGHSKTTWTNIGLGEVVNEMSASLEKFY